MTRGRIIGGTVGCFLFIAVVACAIGFVLFTGAAGIASWFANEWWWNGGKDTVVVEAPAPVPGTNTGTSDDPTLANAGTGVDDPLTATPTPPTGTVPLGTAAGGTHLNPSDKLFTCEEATRPPFYPEELQRLTPWERKKLGIPEDAVARRFRLPNDKSALGQWAKKHNSPSHAYDEEVLIIGLVPTQVCVDAEDTIRNKIMEIKGGICVYKDDNSVAPGAKIVTLCRAPNGEFVTYGDLLPELDVKWGKSRELGDGVWTYCDPEGRRPDPASGYPGACRKGTTVVVDAR